MRSDYAASLRAVWLASPEKSTFDALFGWMGARGIERLLYNWHIWARDDQLPPDLPWVTWLLLGGRGAGKTRAGAEWVRSLALGQTSEEASAMRIALVGETLADVRSVMVEGVSGLLSVHRRGEAPRFEPTKRQLVWPNGAVAQLFSAEDPDGLRGPQFSTAWCDAIDGAGVLEARSRKMAAGQWRARQPLRRGPTGDSTIPPSAAPSQPSVWCAAATLKTRPMAPPATTPMTSFQGGRDPSSRSR